MSIVKQYSEIQSIDKNGIIFDDNSSIVFNDCIGKRYDRNTCVAQRDIAASPPYFEFFSETEIKVVFNKSGMFSKARNIKDFNNFQKQIFSFGYSTYDLS